MDKVFQFHLKIEEKIKRIKEGHWDCVDMASGRFYNSKNVTDDSKRYRFVNTSFGPSTATFLVFECGMKGFIGQNTLDGIKPLGETISLDPYTNYALL